MDIVSGGVSLCFEYTTKVSTCPLDLSKSYSFDGYRFRMPLFLKFMTMCYNLSLEFLKIYFLLLEFTKFVHVELAFLPQKFQKI